MKRPVKQEKGDAGVCVCPDAKLQAQYPLLIEHITDEEWDDGTSRERSTITIICEGGLMKVSLNDRELERSLWRSGMTLQEALGSLEKALGSSKADWRPWPGRKGRQKGS